MSDVMGVGGLQLGVRDYSRIPVPFRTLFLLSTNHIDTGLTFIRTPHTSSYSDRWVVFLVQWTADPHAGFTMLYSLDTRER